MKTDTYHDTTRRTCDTGLIPIRGFQEVSLLDWEGKIASIIFTGGCNLRCGFCHSKDLVSNDPGLPSIPWEEISEFLEKKKGWIDGVEITGGEPALYLKGLLRLIRAIKDMGFLIKLDTNGTMPQAIRSIIDHKAVDYIAMDIKAPLDQKDYSAAVRAPIDIENIKACKDMIISSGIDYEFRTTIVPGLISSAEIEEIARSIVPAKRYRLQQFQAKDTLDPCFLDLKPYSTEELEIMVNKARLYIPDTIIRGN
jgi:pyruvate formate lyase activating enzyme